MMLLICLICLIIYPHGSYAEVFPLSDSSYPHVLISASMRANLHLTLISVLVADSCYSKSSSSFLSIPFCLNALAICYSDTRTHVPIIAVIFQDPATIPVVWHRKMFAFRLAHSSAVRINSRGVRFIPISHTLHLARQDGVTDSISMQEYISREAVRQLRLLQYISRIGNSSSESWMGFDSDDPSSLTPRELNSILASSASDTATNRWRSIQCDPARDSLCHLRSRETDVEYISRLFPNYPGPVYLTQRDSTLLPSDVARYVCYLVACFRAHVCTCSHAHHENYAGCSWVAPTTR